MATMFLLLPPLEFHGGKLLDAVVPAPCLPTDILLEIFVRTDPATLVRCAATSKDHLRRVAAPTFLRGYGHRLDSRFVPSLLLGLYCVFVDDDSDDEDDDQLVRIMVAPGLNPAPTCRSLGEHTVSTLIDWNYTPVAACAGLLFVKDPYTSPDLVKGRVIHTSRPHRCTSIPAADIGDASLVLLAEDHDEENGLVSFRLVALKLLPLTQVWQNLLWAQIFRSQSGRWDWVPGNPVEILLPGGSPCTLHDTEAAVLRADAGATANWLCKSRVSYHVVSFHIDDAQAGVTVIELPPGCQNPGRNSEELLLEPSADRKRLTLLVADGLKINIWARTANSTATSCWARHLVIDVHELRQQWPLPRQVDSEARVKFERWFGERSGTAVLEIDRYGHFALNLATNKLQLLKKFSETGDMRLLCGHEINPLPLLRKLQLLSIA